MFERVLKCDPKSNSRWQKHLTNGSKNLYFRDMNQHLTELNRGLTVDGDVDSLGICVDVVDSCAFVSSCSVSGDRWNFQVLIVCCQIPYAPGV